MTETNNALGLKPLGDKICGLGDGALCDLASRLCDSMLEAAEKGLPCGALYPENLYSDSEGRVFAGSAADEDWKVRQLQFVAPEVFWHGQSGEAADVYSLGMLLYYAASGGKLPFAELSGDVAQQKRMKGESFEAPENCGRRLGEIILKATAFKPTDRYKSIGELKAMLDSAAKNPYLPGEDRAASVFKKEEEQLSEVERMMLAIIAKGEAKEDKKLEDVLAEEPEIPEESEEAAETEEEDIPAEVPSEEPEETEDEEAVTEDIEEPVAGETEEELSAREPEEHIPENSEIEALGAVLLSEADSFEEENSDEGVEGEEAEAAEAETEESEAEAEAETETESDEAPPAEEQPQPIVILEEEKNPELEPVIINRSVLYGKNLERERKIAEKVRRRRRRPFLFVLFLCAILVVVALLSKSCSDSGKEEEVSKSPVPGDAVIIPPENAPSVPIKEEEPEPTPTPTPTPEAPKVSTYEIFVEDVSWTQARARCEEMGGHLVVINDADELQKVIDLANTKNITNIWVGCHRVDGTLVWESEDEIGFYPWGPNEPSYVDGWDGVNEDYVMLWRLNGAWVYNDSRNDPIADYPGSYRGKIAFVCEFEN